MRLISFLFLACFSLNTWASDDGLLLEQAMNQENLKAEQERSPLITISPEEIFRKTQLVFNHYQVPAEKNYQPELDAFDYSTQSQDFNKHLKILDPSSQFSRFFSLMPDRILGFEDRDSKTRLEFVKLTHQKNIARAGSLQGLRVALDPGHMGGDIWDERTGKYVVKGKVKVSEALMALQTSLLIEKQLRAMGAEVLITHRELGPVSKTPYAQLDVKDYARRELRYRSLEAWFQNIISITADSDLAQKFDQSPARTKLFSEIMRGEYYTVREDIFARNEMISAFKPDLTVVIHFDAATREPQANAPNQTFAYVAGNYPATDFSMSETRAHILAHLAKGNQWKDSVQLSQDILTEISTDLQVPIAKEAYLGAPVAKGVFTRNLVLPRLSHEAPLTYLECLYYANAAEFERMTKTDGGQLTIGGKVYAYPQRLNQLSNAITKGIIKFAQR